jgi:hypothetical protein
MKALETCKNEEFGPIFGHFMGFLADFHRFKGFFRFPTLQEISDFF